MTYSGRMLVRVIFIAIFAVFAFASTICHAQNGKVTRYTQIVLAPIPGETTSEATAINLYGDVCGDCGEQGTLWRYNAQPTPLAPFFGGNLPSHPTGINDKGQICCWIRDVNGQVHSVLYDQGKVTPIDALTSGIDTVAFGLNNKGAVVGYGTIRSASTLQVYAHGFLWQAGATPTTVVDLGDLGGGSTVADGVNNQGVVVGVSGLVTKRGQKGILHGFEYRDLKMRDIGSIATGQNSFAHAINDNFAIVGQAGAASGHERAFLSVGLYMKAMPLLAGFTDADASGINNVGQAVGRVYLTDRKGNEISHACLWAGGSAYDINKLVTLLPGEVLKSAVAINDEGQIACNAKIDGAERGVVLSPVGFKQLGGELPPTSQ